MLGIIGAMDQEVSILKEKMEVKKIDKRASMEFYVGILNGKEVVIVKCGVGKVNAAVCTQILADCYQVEAVINTGVAGSLRAEINIGDIVVALDENQSNTLKLFAGIDTRSGEAILRYCNKERYPGKEIRVKQLIVQGVAKHVIKALGPNNSGKGVFEY